MCCNSFDNSGYLSVNEKGPDIISRMSLFDKEFKRTRPPNKGPKHDKRKIKGRVSTQILPDCIRNMKRKNAQKK